MENIGDRGEEFEKPLLSVTEPSADYELIDSGEEEKLERFGSVVLARPDPQAFWKKSLPESEWAKADAYFSRGGSSRGSNVLAEKISTEEKTSSTEKTKKDSNATGKWIVKGKIPDEWEIKLGGLNFKIGLSTFKHTGIFPEQLENWNWITEAIQKSGKISVLNLFGYTGGATLACAKAGAAVTHVDASKVSIGRARENAKLSGLEDKPIRWILDDALAFVKREVRRGSKYDAIVMDPPAFGRGPKNELWKIEKHLPILLEECKKILSENPVFVLLNGYASGYSAISYKNSLESLLNKNGKVEFGELAIRESAASQPASLKSAAGRLLPAGIFARSRKSF